MRHLLVGQRQRPLLVQWMIRREMHWELADVIRFPLDDIADEVLDLSIGSLVMAPYAVIRHYTRNDKYVSCRR